MMGNEAPFLCFILFASSVSVMQEVLIKQIHKVSLLITFADLKCCVDQV